MKIVCINNVELGRDSNGKPRHNRLPLTIGKTYESMPEDQIISQNVRFYMIEKDNDDKSRLYAAQYFVTVDVWREMQLNKLI
jgi:hypothetical protein